MGVKWEKAHLHSHNTNGLAGSNIHSEERAISGDSGKEHGRYRAGLQVVGNAEDEILMYSDVTSIATVRHGAIRVVAVVRVYKLEHRQHVDLLNRY